MKRVPKSLDANGAISLILILLVGVVLVGGAGYYVWQKNRDTTTTKNDQPKATIQKAANKTSTSQSTTPTCTDPSTAEVADIKAAITSGNTAALASYMAPTVKVILAATEGIGDQTPTEAVSDVTSFISGTSSWDFALPAATLTAYKSTPYVTYFPDNAVVGKDSSTTKVISFSFDCDGKINTIFEVGQASSLQ